MVMEAAVGQTKVPADDWSTERLGDRGLFFKGSGIRRNEATSGDLPCVRYGELYTQHDNLILDINSWISECVAGDAQKIKKGDVLFAASGETKDEIGKCATLEVVDTAYAGGDIIVFRPFKDDPKFLGYFLNSPYVQQQKSAKAQGDAVVHISPKALADLSVRIPPYTEQVRIGKILEEADALGEQLRKLIEKKRFIKQGVMQDLLSARRRLPGFSGEWTKRTLEEISEIRSGGTPSTSDPKLWNGGVPWCTPTDITKLRHGNYINETKKKISEMGVLKSSAEVIPENSVIMTSRATIGECAINEKPMTTNQGFKNLVPRSGVDTEFLYYLMKTQKKRLLALCGGSTFLEVGKRQLAKHTVLLPKEEAEQKAISQTLADMDSELEALETRLEKVGQIKQGMMQELLTGKVRLV